MTWALSSLFSSTMLVLKKELEDIEALLLEQQSKVSNSSQHITPSFREELQGLEHDDGERGNGGNILRGCPACRRCLIRLGQHGVDGRGRRARGTVSSMFWAWRSRRVSSARGKKTGGLSD